MTESMKTNRIEGDKTQAYDIPVEGSLGLLALGAVGIMQWRKVRNAHNKQILEEKKNE